MFAMRRPFNLFTEPDNLKDTPLYSPSLEIKGQSRTSGLVPYAIPFNPSCLMPHQPLTLPFLPQPDKMIKINEKDILGLQSPYFMLSPHLSISPQPSSLPFPPQPAKIKK